MSTFRVNKNVNYTVMSNHHLQDKRLSLKAKGLLSYMLSLPDDWDYSLKGLTIGCKDGLDSVRTAVLELEEHGYVRRQKVRNAKGQIIDYDYQVYESPVEDAPAVPGKEGEPSAPSASKSPKSRMKPRSSPFLDFPNLAEPNLEKATQQNTKRQSTNLSGRADRQNSGF
ncbi:helix-turn-helix domain-containing protein [Faecalibacterium sp.]|uniref:helix-turn-helix domain-containing protein n=1 Tax=Faecalibacterium sp. TaxID=1971605 RepID=UPI0039997A8F